MNKRNRERANTCGSPSAKRSNDENDPANGNAHLEQTDQGLALVDEGLVIRGDFSRLIPRCKQNRLQQELIVRAIKPATILARYEAGDVPLAIDATAGLGDDAFLLAACGFKVLMFERDETIASLLADALSRALADERTHAIADRMRLSQSDSITAMQAFANKLAQQTPGQLQANRQGISHSSLVIPRRPDIVILDPMFPARTKSAAVKKKFQLIHQLEKPCQNEEELLQAALRIKPGKVIVKRPAKGPHLANIKPSYSIGGKAIRYDVLVPAQMRL